MRRFLVALALALSIPASASTYTVDDTGDAPDFNPGDDVCSTAAVGGVCTLRAAITEANAHAGPDEIEFDVAGTISPATQYPSIVDTVTIEGRGAPGYTNAPVVKLDGAFSVAVGLHFDAGSDESELIALEISGFSTAGVLVDSDELSIRQNYLGPVTGGTPNGDGLQLNGNGSTVGGADDGGNVISGNQAYGILVTGTDHVISDNFIGTDAAGTSDLANGDDGISISGGATGVTIGSATEGEENVISGNFDVGVSIDDGSGNTIAGNYIGLDVTGTAAIPNFIGVEVNAAGNIIGTADVGNVISGNDDDGIDINADDTVVHNNLIGPDATGTVGIGNFAFGIAAFVVSNVDVGGMGANEGNVISYNGGGGIFFLEVEDSRIVNNIVGLDAAGTNILGNGLEGILLFDSYTVAVGSNVVSGNSGGGIVDAGGVENIIELNRVGTTADGSAAAGNLDTGIELFATLDTIVRSNVVSANGGHGIETTFGSTGAVIHSNIAGLSADLSTPLGNTLDGINVCDGASDTVVGSVALGGNIISANLENGIGVEATALTNNTWAANSIYDNGLLGIDIAIDGVTPNDPDDPDVGPNNYQNYPELVSAVTTPSASQVRGTIDTVPAAAFTIHFYSSPAADPSGFGEGRTYLGATSGTADANGDAAFVFTGPALTAGHVVTATATTADGTSEFSGAEAVATAPAISFSSATYGVAETGVTATITVTRSGDLDAISTVQYATSNDSATAGADYTATSGTLTFAAGDDTETFTVTIANDANDEPAETIDLTLSSPTAATLAAPSTAELTISDDDGPPQLSIDDVSRAEGDGGTTAFTFDVTLSVASGFTVSVDYATGIGTASVGSDYTAVSATTLTFDPGETTQSVTVNVAGDVLFEDDETFFVNLSNATNASFGDNQGLGTIQNDETVPEVSIADDAVSEGENVVFTVTLSGPSENDVTVNYATANDGASAGSDYTAQSAVATITAGTTSTTISVPTTEDALFESDETFFVNLSGAANIVDAQGIGTIEDDDTSPGISIDDEAASEGNNVVFTVTLSAAAGTDISVNYATASGTATAAGDYTAQSGVATITAGNTSTTISVATTDDAVFEADETFVVNLSGAANITDSQGQGTIENDDASPGISIDDEAASEGNAVVFTVTLSAAAGTDITVNYATANGTATAAGDYTAQSGVATITAGTTSTTISVPTTEDAVFEADETFVVNLSGAANITDNQGQGTIENDDTSPGISIGDEAAAEGNAVVFTVTLSAAAGTDVTVNYATANGTATAAGDYTAQSGVATITAGNTSTTISVPTTEDALFESDETFVVNLSGAANITDNQGQGTIENDDASPGISIDDEAASEGNAVVFTVTLAAAAGTDVTVNYATANGTATTASDYTAQSGVATIAAGTTSTTITVPTTEDAAFEANETFVVNLSGAPNITDSQGQGTIENDDASPGISIDDDAASEGNSVVFAVTLSAAAGTDITVNYATANGTATAPGDYTAQSGVATITAGNTSTTITVPTTEDAEFEADETFVVNLSGAANITDNQGQGTIENDDASPGISIDDDAASEGNSVVFTVTLSAAAGTDITVNYATANGTATAPGDYTAQSGVATITAGNTSTTITVPPTEDAEFEADETFVVNLSGAANITDN
ncbi:MAG TPA: Calx-beta domain-containing protein, partial [Thermoanaerobaculia bacterium]